MLAWAMVFSWLTTPSASFSAAAEIDFDVLLFIATLAALVFVAAEYGAEHLNWPWGKERKHLFAVGVLISFFGELIFETGSFG